ncbi:hypothetical protein ACQWU4_14280 [Chryseobacterium sp. MIQD13]|uniref:hypothetical protein n=1 Tax=Chryseobacterium sp. MIQD13 TaxID=3422310 RepID=UPI003D27A923
MNIRLLITFISIVLCNVNCTSQQKGNSGESASNTAQKKSKIEKIEVTEQTRGTNRLITFTPGSKTTSLNGNVSVSALSTADWAAIVKQAEIINLDQIASFKSSSEGRFSDRALASSILITANGKVYESSSFDAGRPPKELEGLYMALFKDTKAKPALPKKNFR